MSAKEKYNKSYVITIVAIAATGGLLFGFDLGVVSGAVNFLQDPKGWGVSDSQIEWITTAMLIGAVFGALTGGKVTDRIGRKKVIVAAAFIASTGAFLTGAATSVTYLILGRGIVGLAIGVASLAVPLYISEISPARMRGALVTMNQLLIAIGVKVSYLTDFLIANDANPFCWRWMFYVGIIPGVILFIGVFFLPETPRWLIAKGFENEGRNVLKKVEEPGLVEKTIAGIKADVARETESASYRELFKPWLRNALIIGVGIMFIQQATGINTIIYYSPKIFKMAGVESNTMSILPSLITGVFALLFTVASILLLDRIGRRPIFFFGLIGMVISLVGIGLSFYLETRLGDNLKYFALASILFYNAFYAISLGPLRWLVLSEVFPLKVRGQG